jgi:hypothetical protein
MTEVMEGKPNPFVPADTADGAVGYGESTVSQKAVC